MALHQSALDDTILLYHKNTQDIPARPKAAIYEQYARYHIQDFYVESICYALGYVYLHELCTARKEIPFEQLPPVMQEFLTYTSAVWKDQTGICAAINDAPCSNSKRTQKKPGTPSESKN